MHALRTQEHMVSANGTPTTRRTDGVAPAEELHRPQREEARTARLFDLKVARPRTICLGFAVIRI